MSHHPALEPGEVAVVTGAASGIGLAAATRFARLGLKLALVDLPGDALEAARVAVADAAGTAADAIAIAADVGRLEDVVRVRDEVAARFGPASVLMNNAGIEAGGRFFSPVETWRRILGVNFWGAVHGMQVFVPDMMSGGKPALVVNTGSKQGITTPPGNAPYNVSKAALKVATEALVHELRQAEGCRATAHLLIPGFVYTGLARARGVTEKPDAAWTPDQTVDFMLAALERGDFYILCPDNDVDRATDERRMAWAMGDIIENRPALSRWDPRFEAAFEAHMRR